MWRRGRWTSFLLYSKSTLLIYWHGVCLPPLDPPVTKTFFGSILYVVIAYLIIFAIAFESPPPSCESEALLETSQHSVVELGHTVTYPFRSDPCFHGILAFWKYFWADDWHEWIATTSASLFTVSGLYTHLERSVSFFEASQKICTRTSQVSPEHCLHSWIPASTAPQKPSTR